MNNENKIKRKLYSKKYYQNNKDKFHGHNKKWYTKKPFKWLHSMAKYWYRNGDLTPFDIWKIAKKQKLKCALSGEKLTKENISLDHLIPKSKGGINTISNVRLTTKDINMAKKTLDDKDFIEMCQKVVDFNKKKEKDETR